MGKAPERATLASLPAPPPRRSEPLGTPGDGKPAHPSPGPHQSTRTPTTGGRPPDSGVDMATQQACEFFQNPLMGAYWEASKGQRATPKRSSNEARIWRMADGLTKDLDDADTDEWWVVGGRRPAYLIPLRSSDFCLQPYVHQQSQ